MLTPDQFDELPQPLLRLYREYEQSVINDIARRLSGMDMTSSAAWQLQRLTESGGLYADIIKKIAILTGRSESELKATFEKAGVQAMEFDDSIYRAAGLDPLPLNLSPAMTNLLRVGMIQTNGTMQNLTLTTAVTGQQAFIDAADLAYMQVSTGAMSYTQAIRAAIKNTAAKGLTVIYPSGHVDQLDVAMRRTVLTGVTQTTGKMQWARADEMGQDLVQTSAHAGSRPSHQLWQGQVFSRSNPSKKYPDFVAVTGYGTVTGLCGANCHHSYYPFFEGISENAYNDVARDELSKKQVTYNGKTMSQYDGTQVQRGIERNIRLYKRQAEALQAGGQDNSAELSAVKAYQAKMRDFIKQTGLQRDPSREVIIKPNPSAAPTTVTTPPAPPAPAPAPIQQPLPVPSTPAITTPAAQPSGRPVSDALDLSAVKNKDMQGQVNLALRSIDKLHGDGELPNLPIVPNTTKRSYGAFHMAADGSPIKISVARGGDHQALTLLHELGHFIDSSAFGQVWSSIRPNGQTNGVMSAALQTDWFKGILQRYNDFNMRSSSDAVKIMIDRKYVSYLVSSREIFARAYAQYIATKSGDKVLLEQLVKLQNSAFPTQWNDADFLPIMSEFDKLFTLKGWIQ